MDLATFGKHGVTRAEATDDAQFAIKLYNNDMRWMPTQANPDDAGYDLKACSIIKCDKCHHFLCNEVLNPYYLEPGDRILIKTGVFIGLTPGWEVQIRPRSGLAWKNGITVLNSPGTIDAGYRDEIGVIMINHGNTSFTINYGDRIAQMVFSRIYRISMEPVDKLDDTNRGLGGFGSSGK